MPPRLLSLRGAAPDNHRIRPLVVARPRLHRLSPFGFRLTTDRSLALAAAILDASGTRVGTQTLTLTIYEQLEASFDVALSIGILLVLISAFVLISYKLLLWRRSSSTSPTLFVPSSSAAA